MKLVFLYSRFADYFYKSLLDLLRNNDNFEAHVIRYKPDENAPFTFEETNNLKFFNYDDFPSRDALLNFISKLEPKLIYTSGWSNKNYNFVVSKLRFKCPTIVGVDNPWKGNLRQYFGVFYFRVYLKSNYSHIWVTGKPQYEFARYLGYKRKYILNDLYSANNTIFNQVYKANKGLKLKIYPKKMIYLGRYVSYKQPLLLAKCFKELETEEATNGWSLEFIGSGPELDKLLSFESDSIKVNNFIKPEALPDKLASCGAFCLPSKSEHWGVAVHEAAATGLPLILSNTTFAGSHFLIDGFNGYSFDVKNRSDLKDKLKLFFTKNDRELNAMSYQSYQLSKVINHKTWTANLLSILN